VNSSTDLKNKNEIGTGYSLLLVEDDKTNQKLMVLQLSDLGFSVRAASSGLEAVEATNGLRFDIILMDCEMPDVNGFEAVKVIRKKEIEKGLLPVPIIALTGHSSEDIRELCLRGGMNDFITKPVEMEALGKAIKHLLLLPATKIQG